MSGGEKPAPERISSSVTETQHEVIETDNNLILLTEEMKLCCKAHELNVPCRSFTNKFNWRHQIYRIPISVSPFQGSTRKSFHNLFGQQARSKNICLYMHRARGSMVSLVQATCGCVRHGAPA